MIEIGTQKTIAKVLVFLSGTPDATSRAIERGTDMRQPVISPARKYLIDKGWIKSRENPPGTTRPSKVYELAKPITDIMDSIKKEKKIEAYNQRALVKKLRYYLDSLRQKILFSDCNHFFYFYNNDVRKTAPHIRIPAAFPGSDGLNQVAENASI